MTINPVETPDATVSPDSPATADSSVADQAAPDFATEFPDITPAVDEPTPVPLGYLSLPTPLSPPPEASSPAVSEQSEPDQSTHTEPEPLPSPPVSTWPPDPIPVPVRRSASTPASDLGGDGAKSPSEDSLTTPASDQAESEPSTDAIPPAGLAALLAGVSTLNVDAPTTVDQASLASIDRPDEGSTATDTPAVPGPADMPVSTWPAEPPCRTAAASATTSEASPASEAPTSPVDQAATLDPVHPADTIVPTEPVSSPDATTPTDPVSPTESAIPPSAALTTPDSDASPVSIPTPDDSSTSTSATPDDSSVSISAPASDATIASPPPNSSPESIATDSLDAAVPPRSIASVPSVIDSTDDPAPEPSDGHVIAPDDQSAVPTPPDTSARHSKRPVGLILLIVIAVLVAVAGLATYLVPRFLTNPDAPGVAASPSEAVQEYLDAVASGDATTALLYSQAQPTNTRFVSDDFLKAAITANPLTDIKVSAQPNPSSPATIQATYSLGGLAVEASFTVRQYDRTWRLDGGFITLNLFNLLTKGVPLTINDSPLGADQKIDLFPGIYTLASTNPMLRLDNSTFTIGYPESSPTFDQMRFVLSDQALTDIHQAAKLKLDTCLASHDLQPAGCGFGYAGATNGTVDQNTLQWTLAPQSHDITTAELHLDPDSVSIASGTVDLAVAMHAISTDQRYIYDDTSTVSKMRADFTDPNAIEVTFGN
jgi:hypothetical protein